MAKPKLKARVINREWCKGCGICIHFCPKNVLEHNEIDFYNYLRNFVS